MVVSVKQKNKAGQGMGGVVILGGVVKIAAFEEVIIWGRS